MKGLSAGLTFVNFATICGLLLGMVAGGLGHFTAFFALILGAGVAVAAYLGTFDQPSGPTIANVSEPPIKLSKRAQLRLEKNALRSTRPFAQRYGWLVLAGLGFVFALFAVRSFCWLLYKDGAELKIQSPNNLGDLALHITYIKNFARGVPLWPENPIYVFSQLRYPAGTDLFNALLSLVSVDLTRGLVWAGLLASIATFYAFLRWGGEFAIAGFLFNGGVAGFQFVRTFQFLDYQTDKTIAWKSIPLSMFVTQRGLLYAIPVGLLLLWHWRERFFRSELATGRVRPIGGPDGRQGAATSTSTIDINGGLKTAAPRGKGPLPFWVELSLYATMPLFHFHTFLALTIVLVCLFASECLHELKFVVDLARKQGSTGLQSWIRDRTKWREALGDIRLRKHVVLMLGLAFLPATFLVWLITDYFRAGSVLAWWPGWVLHQKNNNEFALPFFQFWFLNFGVVVPLIIILFCLCGWRLWKSGIPEKASEELVFLSAALVIFLIGFFVKLAPWEWDNLKVMVWAYFLILPFLWTQLIKQWQTPVRIAVCIALFGSGFVSLFGGLAARGYGFAQRAEIDDVGFWTRSLPATARFASYPTYNHPLLLQGRKAVLGYPGHLWTQGFDYGEVNQKFTAMMNGDPHWREIARALRIRYLFWGREEKLNYPGSTRPWENNAPEILSGPKKTDSQYAWKLYDLDPLEPNAPRTLTRKPSPSPGR